jgi:hypothetical protein
MLRLAVSLLLLAPACGTSVFYTPLVSSPHALVSREPRTVEVCQNEPTRPYVTVGIVATQPDSMYGETRMTPQLVDEMRRQAARAGCDALVLEGSSPAPPSTLGGRAVAAVSYRGACAVYTSAATPQ